MKVGLCGFLWLLVLGQLCIMVVIYLLSCFHVFLHLAQRQSATSLFALENANSRKFMVLLTHSSVMCDGLVQPVYIHSRESILCLIGRHNTNFICIEIYF